MGKDGLAILASVVFIFVSLCALVYYMAIDPFFALKSIPLEVVAFFTFLLVALYLGKKGMGNVKHPTLSARKKSSEVFFLSTWFLALGTMVAAGWLGVLSSIFLGWPSYRAESLNLSQIKYKGTALVVLFFFFLGILYLVFLLGRWFFTAWARGRGKDFPQFQDEFSQTRLKVSGPERSSIVEEVEGEREEEKVPRDWSLEREIPRRFSCDLRLKRTFESVFTTFFFALLVAALVFLIFFPGKYNFEIVLGAIGCYVGIIFIKIGSLLLFPVRTIQYDNQGLYYKKSRIEPDSLWREIEKVHFHPFYSKNRPGEVGFRATLFTSEGKILELGGDLIRSKFIFLFFLAKNLPIERFAISEEVVEALILDENYKGENPLEEEGEFKVKEIPLVLSSWAEKVKKRQEEIREKREEREEKFLASHRDISILQWPARSYSQTVLFSFLIIFFFFATGLATGEISKHFQWRRALKVISNLDGPLPERMKALEIIESGHFPSAVALEVLEEKKNPQLASVAFLLTKRKLWKSPFEAPIDFNYLFGSLEISRENRMMADKFLTEGLKENSPPVEGQTLPEKWQKEKEKKRLFKEILKEAGELTKDPSPFLRLQAYRALEYLIDYRPWIWEVMKRGKSDGNLKVARFCRRACGDYQKRFKEKMRAFFEKNSMMKKGFLMIMSQKDKGLTRGRNLYILLTGSLMAGALTGKGGQNQEALQLINKAGKAELPRQDLLLELAWEFEREK